MNVTLAATAGFCFGVKRAIEMVHAALDAEDSPIYCLGPLIHNPQVVAELEQKGLAVVNSLDEIAAGRIVIRSHGAGPDVFAAARARGLTIIDATCPFVKNVQQLAVLLKDQDYQVIICGERDHAEVQGVLQSVGGTALVVNDADELTAAQLGSKVGIVSQTTQEAGKLQQVVVRALPMVKEIRLFNTICLATSKRQEEAAELSRKMDRMVVVGGKNSANTRRLAEICRSNGTKTYQVESAAEIQSEWFTGAERVGITAGASTPEQLILDVVHRINQLGGAEQ